MRVREQDQKQPKQRQQRQQAQLYGVKPLMLNCHSGVCMYINVCPDVLLYDQP